MRGRLIVAAAAAAGLLLGCDSSGTKRETELKDRITQLEREVAELRGNEASTPEALEKRIAELQKQLDEAKAASAKARTPVLVHEDWKEVPLDPSVQKALGWLVSVQGSDGGWGQDGGHAADARQGVTLESSGNDVANTAFVCLALLRSGNTPESGPHCEALCKGLMFILERVEKAPAEGLEIITVKGTQVQRKLGPHIDTFLATMFLSEVDGMHKDAATAKRVRAALDKCIAKVEKNQMEDGSWNYAGGWAPVIGTSLASRGLYNAQQKGASVSVSVMKKVEDYSEKQFDARSGRFSAGEAGAGVELYQAAQALENNSRDEASREKYAEMNKAAEAKLASADFVEGFGNMGGEEFVSYMNVSDSLIRSGGEAWTTWNTKIKERLTKTQNADGTWAGHHCITGRVACTSASIMTILAERGCAKAQ